MVFHSSTSSKIVKSSDTLVSDEMFLRRKWLIGNDILPELSDIKISDITKYLCNSLRVNG